MLGTGTGEQRNRGNVYLTPEVQGKLSLRGIVNAIAWGSMFPNTSTWGSTWVVSLPSLGPGQVR